MYRTVLVAVMLAIGWSAEGLSSVAAEQGTGGAAEKIGVKRGICVVLGDAQCQLAL
jgi:hypothetical protein